MSAKVKSNQLFPPLPPSLLSPLRTYGAYPGGEGGRGRHLYTTRRTTHHGAWGSECQNLQRTRGREDSTHDQPSPRVESTISPLPSLSLLSPPKDLRSIPRRGRGGRGGIYTQQGGRRTIGAWGSECQNLQRTRGREDSTHDQPSPRVESTISPPPPPSLLSPSKDLRGIPRRGRGGAGIYTQQGGRRTIGAWGSECQNLQRTRGREDSTHDQPSPRVESTISPPLPPLFFPRLRTYGAYPGGGGGGGGRHLYTTRRTNAHRAWGSECRTYSELEGGRTAHRRLRHETYGAYPGGGGGGRHLTNKEDDAPSGPGGASARTFRDGVVWWTGPGNAKVSILLSSISLFFLPLFPLPAFLPLFPLISFLFSFSFLLLSFSLFFFSLSVERFPSPLLSLPFFLTVSFSSPPFLLGLFFHFSLLFPFYPHPHLSLLSPFGHSLYRLFLHPTLSPSLIALLLSLLFPLLPPTPPLPLNPDPPSPPSPPLPHPPLNPQPSPTTPRSSCLPSTYLLSLSPPLPSTPTLLSLTYPLPRLPSPILSLPPRPLHPLQPLADARAKKKKMNISQDPNERRPRVRFPPRTPRRA
ncbi:hypothetical protein C7M84_006709 [Penaeus vannamei]|uniref:Uncharacterized protein n=1 Tax=Penaeus vannamei TaxID=6689 RepID=A0A423TEC2_PENVA|nr:hypothetical protein C7M84_006709 [Penaeus vannamei]